MSVEKLKVLKLLPEAELPTYGTVLCGGSADYCGGADLHRACGLENLNNCCRSFQI